MNKKPQVSLIAAIGSNRELGKNNKLLWSIPEDMKRFKEITLGHPVIMGRTTFESLHKPLSQRLNIVITRNKKLKINGCLVVNSLKEAIKVAKEKEKSEIFIIGGGQIYEQGIELADKLYLTKVKGTFKADTFFPDYSRFKKIIYKKQGQSKQYQYTFLELSPE